MNPCALALGISDPSESFTSYPLLWVILSKMRLITIASKLCALASVFELTTAQTCVTNTVNTALPVNNSVSLASWSYCGTLIVASKEDL